MRPTAPSRRRLVQVRLSSMRALVAAAVGSLVVLAIVYAIVGRLTTVPGGFAPGDAPALTPVTDTEKIEPTRAHHHSGVAATRVRLPAAAGTQGATFSYYLDHPQVLRASLWLLAKAGRRYSIVATNQDGSDRAVARHVTATGNWQRLTLRITPKPGDSVVYLSVIRARRAGTETFDLDDVSVTAG